MSRAVRVSMLGVLFVLVAAACVGFLVVSGGVNPTGSRMILAGGSFLFIAVLAASVSALGPKYRPTPFLTPITAGVFTVLLATTVVFASHSQFAPPGKQPATRGVAARHVPPAPQAKGAKVAPEAVSLQAPAVAEPPPAPPSPAKPVRVLDATADSAAPAAVPAAQPAAPQTVSLAPPPASKPAAPDTKVAAVAQGSVKDAGTPVAISGDAAKQQAATGPATPAKKPVAVATIPSPKAAPPLPSAGTGAPISLQTGFDTSTPASQSAGPPLALAAVAGQSAQSAIPPLPRIRPCGAGGPACP